jgi:hypothetical protein
MKRRYRILTGKATSKSVAEQAAGLAALQSWAKHSLEELSATMRLMVLDLMLSAETQERAGERRRQVGYRHGQDNAGFESSFSQTRWFTRRVKRWRSGTMAPRWRASGLMGSWIGVDPTLSPAARGRGWGRSLRKCWRGQT